MTGQPSIKAESTINTGNNDNISPLGVIEGGNNVVGTSTLYTSLVTGYSDFVSLLNSTQPTTSPFGPGVFLINSTTGDLVLPGDFSAGGTFTINDTMTFNGETPTTLGWDLTAFTLTLPGGQSISFFPPARAMPWILLLLLDE